MKRIFLLTLLTLAFSIATFANTINFLNSGGTLSGTSAGLNLSGSTLIDVGSVSGTNLGSIFFTTSALLSGSLQTGGIFAAGGSFQIVGNGTGGVPNTVIFNGSFSGPVTWTLVTLGNGTHNYTLSGLLTGAWFTGQTVNGPTVQLTINMGKGFFNGTTTIGGGETEITTPTPEPSSFIYFGTGLAAMAAVVRRKKTPPGEDARDVFHDRQ